MKMAGNYVPNGKRNGIVPYPNTENYSVADGERSELVFISQLMLNAVRLNYDLPELTVSGIYDEATADSVKEYQRINLLPVTGEIDPVTWDLLADDYNLTVNDNQ